MVNELEWIHINHFLYFIAQSFCGISSQTNAGAEIENNDTVMCGQIKVIKTSLVFWQFSSPYRQVLLNMKEETYYLPQP